MWKNHENLMGGKKTWGSIYEDNEKELNSI
jgi:hypothetical protein